MIVIKRTEDGKYVLVVDGEAVESYQQTKMRHPDDWEDDAINHGADPWVIMRGDWEYEDERDNDV